MSDASGHWTMTTTGTDDLQFKCIQLSYNWTHLWIVSFQSRSIETQLVRLGISFHGVTHWSWNKDPFKGAVKSKFLEVNIKTEQDLSIVLPDGEYCTRARTACLTQKMPGPPKQVPSKAGIVLAFVVCIFWINSASPVQIGISEVSFMRTKDICDWHPNQWLIAYPLSAYLSGWLTNCDWWDHTSHRKFLLKCVFNVKENILLVPMTKLTNKTWEILKPHLLLLVWQISNETLSY